MRKPNGVTRSLSAGSRRGRGETDAHERRGVCFFSSDGGFASRAVRAMCPKISREKGQSRLFGPGSVLRPADFSRDFAGHRGLSARPAGHSPTTAMASSHLVPPGWKSAKQICIQGSRQMRPSMMGKVLPGPISEERMWEWPLPSCQRLWCS